MGGLVLVRVALLATARLARLACSCLCLFAFASAGASSVGVGVGVALGINISVSVSVSAVQCIPTAVPPLCTRLRSRTANTHSSLSSSLRSSSSSHASSSHSSNSTSTCTSTSTSSCLSSSPSCLSSSQPHHPTPLAYTFTPPSGPVLLLSVCCNQPSIAITQIRRYASIRSVAAVAYHSL